MIALHRDLHWTDQHNWSPIVDAEERTVTGGLVVEPWTKDGGRPITLESPTSDFGLVTRAVVDALGVWGAIADLEMELDYHGDQFDVMFRNDSAAAVTAQQVWVAGPPTGSDLMTLNLKLRTL